VVRAKGGLDAAKMDEGERERGEYERGRESDGKRAVAVINARVELR
jgi:hypothetical protein